MSAEKKEVKGAETAAPAPSQGEGTQTKSAEGKATKAKAKKFTVISPFADRDSFGKMWNEGDDVSHFDAKRIADCVSRGLVKEG